jgi:hypothetical protein
MKSHCNGALFLVVWTSTFHLRAPTEVITVRNVANISYVENSREKFKRNKCSHFKKRTRDMNTI